MSQDNEKLNLIKIIMTSYGVTRNDKQLVDRFDKLYEMDKQKLKYLAQLRGIIYKEEMNI